MRHQKAGKKLNRTGSHRNAMFRNMVTSLFNHGRIRTTHSKAKELRRWADRMITLAKRGDLHARRQALAVMRDTTVVHKLFEEAQSRFGGRAGGYTRVVKIGRRTGDAAPISLIEFVTEEPQQKRKKKGAKVAKKEVSKVKKESPVKPKEKKKAASAETGKEVPKETTPTTKKDEASGDEELKPKEKKVETEPKKKPSRAKKKAPASPKEKEVAETKAKEKAVKETPSETEKEEVFEPSGDQNNKDAQPQTEGGEDKKTKEDNAEG